MRARFLGFLGHEVEWNTAKEDQYRILDRHKKTRIFLLSARIFIKLCENCSLPDFRLESKNGCISWLIG